MNKKILTLLGIIGVGIAGCSSDAGVAAHNLSKAADNFEINRRIVFFNGITNDYILVIEGLCSQQQTEKKLAVTCKTGHNQYKKHFLGLSDNATYFSEQMESAAANVFHYRVTFKPAAIVPDINFRN